MRSRWMQGELLVMCAQTINRWTPLEIKEPVLVERALLARTVRQALRDNPDGLTSQQINGMIRGGGACLYRLRKLGFARLMSWNNKDNPTKRDTWFWDTPPDGPPKEQVWEKYQQHEPVSP